MKNQKQKTMKRYISLCALSLALSAAAATPEWVGQALDRAVTQLSAMAESTVPGQFPKAIHTDYSLGQLEEQLEMSVDDFYPEIEQRKHATRENYGKLRTAGYRDWCSGFFPGSLWLAYELTGNEEMLREAKRYTNALAPLVDVTDTHDLGFMAYCSYGNALRLAPNDSIRPMLVRIAGNLANRFDKNTGVIRSWDFGPWNYPVIIDNMMNLELLFQAAKMSGNKELAKIADTHATTTLHNHFRPDKTCYHVVSYNNDGTIERKGTFQGKNHESAWSRGQGWAVYGYTEAFRNTGKKEYLNQAVAVADMIMKRNTAPDLIPYWDFDAPVLASTPRDASAAAIYASAFLELSTMVKDGKKYFDYAETILRNLSSPQYLADANTNCNFILKHSTGSLPHGSEIDTPLSYADYYYLEALLRYTRILNGKPVVA